MTMMFGQGGRGFHSKRQIDDCGTEIDMRVFPYSKSVSRKNSKCLDIVLVQVTPVVQKVRISLPC